MGTLVPASLLPPGGTELISTLIRSISVSKENFRLAGGTVFVCSARKKHAAPREGLLV